VRDDPVGPGGEKAPAPGPWRPWVLTVILLVIPGLLYSAIPILPFLPLTTAQKAGLSAGLVSRYRRCLDPRDWFRKR